MSHFDWPDVLYFQAKFGYVGKELKQAKLFQINRNCHFLISPLEGGLTPPCENVSPTYLYRRAYKQESPSQRFLPRHDWQKLPRGRRTTLLAPILSPPCVNCCWRLRRQKFSPKSHKLACSHAASWSLGDWTVHITTLQCFTQYLHNNDFFDLYSTTQADFQSTVNVLDFITPLFPRLLLQQNVSSIQVENFRYS